MVWIAGIERGIFKKVEETRKSGNNVVSSTQKTGRRNEENNHVSHMT
jgi:hypothetical protein